MPRPGRKQRRATVITIGIALAMVVVTAAAIFLLEKVNDPPPPPSMLAKSPPTPPTTGGKVALPETVSARIVLSQKGNGGLLGWDEMSVQTAPDLASIVCNSWRLQKLFGYGQRYEIVPSPCSAKGLPERPKLQKKSWLLVTEEPADPLESTLRSRSSYANIKHQEMMLFLSSHLEWRRVRYRVTQAEAGTLEPMRTFQYRLYADEKSCRWALAKLEPPVQFIAEAESSWIEQAIEDQKKRVASVCKPEGKPTTCKTSKQVLRYLKRRQMSPTRPQKIDPPRCEPAME